MANGINKFLNFLKLTDEDDYDEDDQYYDDYDDLDDEKELEKEEKRMQKEQRREEKKFSSRKTDDYDDTVAFSPKKPSQKPSPAKVVPIHASISDFEVCIIKPVNFGESQQVCETLLGGQPVVVNLEGIDILEAQRIMDFISGCIFSINGNMRQVSRYIFIFSPKNVDISGDYIQNVTESDEGINIPTLNKEF